MRLGLSYVGLIYLVMLFVPNIIWAHGRQPKGYEQYVKNENRICTSYRYAGNGHPHNRGRYRIISVKIKSQNHNGIQAKNV